MHVKTCVESKFEVEHAQFLHLDRFLFEKHNLQQN